jgi:hypothetical protein
MKTGAWSSTTSSPSARSRRSIRGRCAAKKDSARSTCAVGKVMLGSRIQVRHSRAGRSGSSAYAVCPSSSTVVRLPMRSSDVSKPVVRSSGSWNSIFARAPPGVDERWICGRAGSVENRSAVPRYTTLRSGAAGAGPPRPRQRGRTFRRSGSRASPAPRTPARRAARGGSRRRGSASPRSARRPSRHGGARRRATRAPRPAGGRARGGRRTRARRPPRPRARTRAWPAPAVARPLPAATAPLRGAVRGSRAGRRGPAPPRACSADRIPADPRPGSCTWNSPRPRESGPPRPRISRPSCRRPRPGASRRRRRSSAAPDPRVQRPGPS